jgi:hypothetical protein
LHWDNEAAKFKEVAANEFLRGINRDF